MSKLGYPENYGSAKTRKATAVLFMTLVKQGTKTVKQATALGGKMPSNQQYETVEWFNDLAGKNKLKIRLKNIDGKTYVIPA